MYALARDFVTQTHRSLFITGKAGTGKTTFLKSLKELTGKKMAVVAPTGIAAINAGGTTIHSFFQLPITPFIPNAEGKKHLLEKTRLRSYRRTVLKELELLVVDEVSMVRADTLDAMDTMLRSVRNRHLESFGGVQVVFLGDLFQLSPVLTESDQQVLKEYYPSPYFFHSRVLIHQPPLQIEFSTIFRQNNETFIHILNEVRNNNLSNHHLQQLMQRYDPHFEPNNNDGYVILTTHNYKADKINNDELEKLPNENIRFEARVEGDFSEKNFPTEKILNLKIGAKVIIIKNDTETPRRFYNGKTAVIRALTNEKITVLCTDEEETIDLFRMEWENIHYKCHSETHQIEEEVVGKFTQFPVRLAWAITIHKSQGLTFKKAVIDAGDAFAPGQVYVALSRCTSLDGIVLRSKINPLSLQNDVRIVEYESYKAEKNTLKETLQTAILEVRKVLIQQLFTYSVERKIVDKLKQLCRSEATSFNSETLPHIHQVDESITELLETGMQFNAQLNHIFTEDVLNETFLTSRINAAFDYFRPKIDTFIALLKQSPASTDNQEYAADYNRHVSEIYELLALKSFLMRQLPIPFDAALFYTVRNQFQLERITIQAYSKVANSKGAHLKHPGLYHALLELRNNLGETQHVPLFYIASNKTLQELSESLPLTTKDLMKINGFGKKKVEKYSHVFLPLIQQYCLEHSITEHLYAQSMIDSKKGTKGESSI